MNPEYQLRLIQKKDNPQMANVIRKVMEEFGAVGEGYSINDPEVDQMFEAYDQVNARYYVIADGERILGGGGIAALQGASTSVCELKKMYFFPELRGLGFGKKMMFQCLEDAKALGYQQCYLETVERMEGANILYQKLGFKKLDHAMGSTGHSACESWYVIDLNKENEKDG